MTQKFDYIKDVMNKCDFLFLQEHCLFENQAHVLGNIGEVSYLLSSAMDESKPLIGRPHGGTAIIWNNNIGCKVDLIKLSFDRLICCKVTMPNNFVILIVNLYLPCDDRYVSAGYHTTVELLNEVMLLQAGTPHDVMIVGGDLNADFKRHTPHVNVIRELMNVAKLTSGMYCTKVDVPYTFESKGSGAKSIIDHLCISQEYLHTLSEYFTLQSVNNFSDHDALLAKLVINLEHHKKQPRAFKSRPAWYKASNLDIENYTIHLDNKLDSIVIPHQALYCENVRCDSHKNDLMKYYDAVVSSCLEAETQNIPITGNCSSHNRMPGWNDLVSGVHQQALFHHRQWKDSGRPIHGDIYENMKKSRRDYHYAVR